MLGCAGTLYNVEQSENFPSNYFSTITAGRGRNTNGSQASPGPGTSQAELADYRVQTVSSDTGASVYYQFFPFWGTYYWPCVCFASEPPLYCTGSCLPARIPCQYTIHGYHTFSHILYGCVLCSLLSFGFLLAFGVTVSLRIRRGYPHDRHSVLSSLSQLVELQN